MTDEHFSPSPSSPPPPTEADYEAIAAALFPRLNVDVLLLEYDTSRAGDFRPLRHVLPQHTVVLGLLTTKHGRLENAALFRHRSTLPWPNVPLRGNATPLARFPDEPKSLESRAKVCASSGALATRAKAR